MSKETYYIGEQSLTFPKEVYLISSASVVGKKEGEGPLGEAFDMICEDDKFGEDTWEMAESTLQKEALALAMGKAKVKPQDVRYLRIPVFGSYVRWGRICKDCGGAYIQPLCQCGETVSFSPGICQSKTRISYLDRHRKRSLSFVRQKRRRTNYRNYHW